MYPSFTLKKLFGFCQVEFLNMYLKFSINASNLSFEFYLVEFFKKNLGVIILSAQFHTY